MGNRVRHPRVRRFLSWPVVLSLPVLLSCSPQVNANVRARQAETAFRLGVQTKDTPDLSVPHFREAARCYKRLFEHGIHSPALFRNWGKAEFLADRLPQAILVWRLGLREYPHDADLWQNLQYARRTVTYPTNQKVQPPAPDWPPMLPQPTLWHLLVCLTFFVTICCAVLARWWWVRRWHYLLWASLTVVGIVVVINGWILLQFHIRKIRNQPVVVIAVERVSFQCGNGDSYPPNPEIPVLSRGMEAGLLFEREDWLQIELADNRIGWVPRSAVLIGSDQSL